MEVILNAGDSVKIPENCTVVERDGMAFFEPIKPKFKKGDFVTNEERVMIIKNYPNEYFAMVYENRFYQNNKYGISFSEEYKFNYSTEAEKQLLLDKLHENGKDWDAEKCEIVDLKYVPKIGDCLKLKYGNSTTFIECSGLEDGKYPCGYNYIIDDNEVCDNNEDYFGWKAGWKYTKITREELQAEFNKLGYEYDFNTHTVKKIEWKPKAGEVIWFIDNQGDVLNFNNDRDRDIYPNEFRSRELAEAALELLKNAKHY